MDVGWRIEQTVDVVTSHFEHYPSWTVGAVVELVNLQLADQARVPGARWLHPLWRRRSERPDSS